MKKLPEREKASEREVEMRGKATLESEIQASNTPTQRQWPEQIHYKPKDKESEKGKKWVSSVRAKEREKTKKLKHELILPPQ